jgi:MoaA/NifB/PqqE/SkfB family radical SAM enzyme
MKIGTIPMSTDPPREIPLAYWSRYVRIVWRYGTLKKYYNLIRACFCYLRNASRVPTLPAFLRVEISRLCHVGCKYCSEKKTDIVYPFSLYQKLIDALKDYIFVVSLYEIGEPLLNKDVIDYIQYAYEHNVGTIISTSLSVVKPDSFWHDLVASGLDYLIVAVDGVTGEVYNRYRTYGDLNLVMANLKKIQEYRKQHRHVMFLEWQMLDLPWNKHEQEPARKLAKEFGCDSFHLIKEATIPRANYHKDFSPRNHNCLLPFVTLIINAFNQVRPCYKIYGYNNIVGDLFQNNFAEVWNGPEIALIRNKATIAGRIPCRFCRE